jgi:hypothetical protein
MANEKAEEHNGDELVTPGGASTPPAAWARFNANGWESDYPRASAMRVQLRFDYA